jgi:hypothetical protein
MGRTIGDVLRCSSSAVTRVLPKAQPDRGGIAHRLRSLGQGREVPMRCGRRRMSSMCSINRRRAATFWRDRPSPADDVYVGSHLRFDLSNR